MRMRSKFHGKCRRCGALFPAGTEIDWEPGVGATHAGGCVAAEATTPASVTADTVAIVEFLLAAKARGLKHPKVAFLGPGNTQLRLSLAGHMAKVPGAVQVFLDRQWLGRVNPDGGVVGTLAVRTDVLDLLDTIAADPAKAASEYGAVRCSCSFCFKGLSDDGSIEVGYGARCAERWGLPHKRRGTKALRPIVESATA